MTYQKPFSIITDSALYRGMSNPAKPRQPVSQITHQPLIIGSGVGDQLLGQIREMFSNLKEYVPTRADYASKIGEAAAKFLDRLSKSYGLRDNDRGVTRYSVIVRESVIPPTASESRRDVAPKNRSGKGTNGSYDGIYNLTYSGDSRLFPNKHRQAGSKLYRAVSSVVGKGTQKPAGAIDSKPSESYDPNEQAVLIKAAGNDYGLKSNEAVEPAQMLPSKRYAGLNTTYLALGKRSENAAPAKRAPIAIHSIDDVLAA
jgi:hypothetical protein